MSKTQNQNQGPNQSQAQGQQNQTPPEGNQNGQNTPATPPALPGANASQQPQPASYHDLKAALPGADAEFIASQLEANATVGRAQSAWMAEQSRRLEEAQNNLQQAREEAANSTPKKPGVNTLGNGGGAKGSQETPGDPIAAYRQALAAKTAEGMSRQDAVLALEAEQPELHVNYVEAINASLKDKEK